MRTKIVWAELHAPLFMAGVNLGQKLPSAEKKHALKMEYDEERHHLYITFNNVTHRLPEAGILSMLESGEIEAERLASQTVKDVQKADYPPKFDPNAAQVDSPTAHVFAGAGKGQTGLAEAFAKAGKT